MTWLLYAFISAAASALTAILSKLGIEGVPSTLATAIRSAVIVVAMWLMVLALNEHRGLPALSRRMSLNAVTPSNHTASVEVFECSNRYRLRTATEEHNEIESFD